LTVGTSSIQTNRHLTILDNGMLEECVNHKQFEYGWRTVYERMGPMLEDRDTTKIVMRLCKRAFLGHGGLGPNLPGSPNLLARDMYFSDGHYLGREPSGATKSEEQQEDRDDYDYKDNEDEDMRGNPIETIEQRIAVLEHNRRSRQDPEIWEARAWVIYNKAMMNPSLFLFNITPTASPTTSQQQQQPTSSQQQQHIRQQSTAPTLSSSAVAGGTVGTNTVGLKLLPASTGTTSLTVFLHNILTVAINSPEQSSRFMKAFRIYSSMRQESSGQYQAQLRDPFVMTCMVKVIYDTILTVVQSQQQQSPQGQQQHQSHNPMSIGPLLDLVFEIFADMRNLGPIRSLPQLCALAPSTSGAKHRKRPHHWRELE
jgi:hypothetical protein